MIAIMPHEVTPAILALFDITQPTMPRAFNVLEGVTRGQMLVDDPAQPAWAVVRESTYGTLYCGGAVSAPLLATLVAQFRQLGDVGVGCWPTDRLSTILPPNPAYDGLTLYFTDRSPQVALAPLMRQLPSGYILTPRDERLFARSPDYNAMLAAFGTLEHILRLTLGVVVLHDDVVLCEAGTGAATHGRIEIGVTTAESQRQRGLASAACANLIARCEARGYATWWDCAKQNIASTRLARKLGYQNEREYRYLWWPEY